MSVQAGLLLLEKCQKDDWADHKLKCAIALARVVKEVRREHGREDEAVADARMQSGVAHLHQGRYGEADKCFLEARRVYFEALGDGHFKIVSICHQLGKPYACMFPGDDHLQNFLLLK